MQVPKVLLAGLIGSIALPNSAAYASALSVGRITASASHVQVRYRVSLCEKQRADLHFAFSFRALDQPSATFRDSDFFRFSMPGCGVYRGQFPNKFARGLWKLGISISDSRGTLLRRSARIFLPAPAENVVMSGFVKSDAEPRLLLRLA